MDNFFDIPGFESVDFQVNSKLASRLEKCFQETLDYRDEFIKTRFTDVNPDMNLDSTNKLILEFLMHFKLVTSPEIVKIIREESGLEIRNVIQTGNEIQGPTLNIGVNTAFDDVRAAIDTEARITGTSGLGFPVSAPGPVEEMKHLADVVDLKNSKLGTKRFGNNSKRRIATELYIDPVGLFMSRFFLSVNGPEKADFTAAEMTAIMLHEIGHIFTLAEHSADLFATANSVKAQINNLEKDPSSSARRKMIATLEKDIPNLLKRIRSGVAKIDDADSFKAMITACNKAADWSKSLAERLRSLEDANAETESVGMVITSTLAAAIVTILNLFWNLVIALLGGFIFYALMHEASISSHRDRTFEGTKAGDVKTTRNNVFLVERWADEFVSRHGYSADLATALQKMHLIWDELETTMTLSNRVRGSKIWNSYIVFLNFVVKYTSLSTYFPFFGSGIYETTYKRFKRAREQQLAVFRYVTKMVPESQVRTWIENIDRLDVALQEESPLLVSRDTADAVLHLLECIVNPVEWSRCLINGQLERDYSVLHNRIDAIRDNALYYWSEKLKRS